MFYSSPQRIGCHPVTLVGGIFFTQPTDSTVALFQKHPHRHTQKCLPTEHPLAQISWHIKLTITVLILSPLNQQLTSA